MASLDLSRNDSVSLKTSVVKRLVQNLTEIRELYLDDVDMSSVLLSSLMNLSSSLTSLTLKSCILRRRLPDHIFCLPKLLELSLTDSLELTCFFSMVNCCKPLRSLDVSHTICSGESLKKIGKLIFLRHLILSGCNFNRSILALLGNLTSYKTHCIGLPMNFAGALPMWIGNLTKVTKLLLWNNSFIGQIPSLLSNVKDLTFVNLRYNNLEGTIPDFFTNLNFLVL